ncbi:MAG: NAD-dependent epimerase/dehydratase family protein [Myxococcales bacterium]|nr:NAD-dependent epimerase/dehydratase family protein [Myxococcales bacterium]
MKVMVTGAHGFMGSNLTRVLLEEGYEVRACVRPGGNFSTLEGLDAELFEADLTDSSALAEACKDIEVIFHLASCTNEWNWWPVYKRINVDGTRDLLEGAVAAGVKRIVYMSSLAVHHFHGITDGDEETAQDGFLFTGYARSKIEAEKLLREYHDAGKIEIVIIRPGVFPYGPNDQTHVRVFDAMIKGGWAYVNGGRALVSTVYIDNLAHGLILAAKTPEAAGKSYIIADDYRLTWREFSEAFIKALGGKASKMSSPLWLAYSLGWMLEKFYRTFRIKSPPFVTRYTVSLAGKDFYFLPKRAEQELGYEPKVSWEEGVERTARWYLDKHVNKS